MNVKITFFLSYYTSKFSQKRTTKKIYCRFQTAGKVRVFSTGHEIQKDLWDKKAGRVHPWAPDASFLNGFLDQTEQSLQTICARDPSLPARRHSFKKLLLQEIARQQSDFNEAFLHFLEQKSNGYTLSTVRKWKSLLALLEKFSAASETRLTLTAVTQVFVDSFRSYLMHVCDQSDRSVTGYIRMLFSFLRWAGKHGYSKNISQDSMQGILDGLNHRGGNLPWLLDEDLEKLSDLVRRGGVQEAEAVLLLAVCFTGIRTGEVRMLAPNSLSGNILQVPGKKMRRIYLTEEEREIVSMFLTFLSKGLYGRPHQSGLNKILRKGALSAGLQRPVSLVRYKQGKPLEAQYPLWKTITMETARRTFLYRLNEKAFPVNWVLEMSGCSTPAALAGYLRSV